MAYQIEGIEHLDYKTKDGDRVTGYRVHFSYDLPSSDDGRACDNCWVRPDVFEGCPVTVGDSLMPVYDKRGRVISFVHSL